jgi:hypothetical protein
MKTDGFPLVSECMLWSRLGLKEKRKKECADALDFLFQNFHHRTAYAFRALFTARSCLYPYFACDISARAAGGTQLLRRKIFARVLVVVTVV